MSQPLNKPYGRLTNGSSKPKRVTTPPRPVRNKSHPRTPAPWPLWPMSSRSVLLWSRLLLDIGHSGQGAGVRGCDLLRTGLGGVVTRFGLDEPFVSLPYGLLSG